MNTPFFIAALPRSRTAWVANLLTFGSESFCYHEPLRWTLQPGPPDWLALVREAGPARVGFSDTAFGWYWQQALAACPEARVVLLWRSLEEVKTNWNEFVRGAPALHDSDGRSLRTLEGNLLDLQENCHARERAWLAMEVGQLDHISGVRGLWEFALPRLPFPERRARMLMDMDIQAKLERYIRTDAAVPRVRTIETETKGVTCP